MINKNVPKHIAIIMDGNRTWARENGFSAIEGHRRGAETVSKVIKGCMNFGVEYLTLFAFSTENWKRDKLQVEGLMHLLHEKLTKKKETFIKEKIRLIAIGDKEGLPSKVVSKLNFIEEETSKDYQFTLVLALNYGARAEIVNACKGILQDFLHNPLLLENLSEDQFSRYLYTNSIPDPELLIRTSGQQRISNFLLWQLSYAEFYFTSVLWPDFSEQLLQQAIEEYQLRMRKFGG